MLVVVKKTRSLKVRAALNITTSTRKMEAMPTRQQRRPNGSESSNLNVRVPSDVLAAAKAKAAENEETLSAAVVRMLREYASPEEARSP